MGNKRAALTRIRSTYCIWNEFWNCMGTTISDPSMNPQGQTLSLNWASKSCSSELQNISSPFCIMHHVRDRKTWSWYVPQFSWMSCITWNIIITTSSPLPKNITLYYLYKKIQEENWNWYSQVSLSALLHFISIFNQDFFKT